MTTKEKILYESLNLFSEKGYEATSIDMIAAAVGIKGPSLYKHFKGKQDIFDSLVEMVSEIYDKNSFFLSQAEETQNTFCTMTPDEISEKFIEQIHFSMSNPAVKKIRRLLTIEQFSNERIEKLKTFHFYTAIYNYYKELIRKMIDCGRLINGDTEAMAAQLSFPVSIWLSLLDTEPDREEEVDDLIRKHVTQFFSVYTK